MAKEPPIGVRLNNPGNLLWGSPWEGLVPREQSRYYKTGTAQQQRFCQFKDAASGIRAIARTLITYADKRVAAGGAIDTVREVIHRWAPPNENDTGAYARAVARHLGLEPGEVIDVKDYGTMKGLIVGIIAHENARLRLPPDVIEEGMHRAGMVRKVKTAPVPANASTIAGGATAQRISALHFQRPGQARRQTCAIGGEPHQRPRLRVSIAVVLVVSAWWWVLARSGNGRLVPRDVAHLGGARCGGPLPFGHPGDLQQGAQ